MQISRRLTLLICLATASPLVSGKCTEGFVAFTGIVTDSSGRPLPGAQVGVSWTEGSAPQGPAIATTDTNGNYRIPVTFSRDSGFSLFGGDKCDSFIAEVSVAAFTATLQSQAISVVVGNVDLVSVPILQIDTKIQSEPLWPSNPGSAPL